MQILLSRFPQEKTPAINSHTKYLALLKYDENDIAHQSEQIEWKIIQVSINTMFALSMWAVDVLAQYNNDNKENSEFSMWYGDDAGRHTMYIAMNEILSQSPDYELSSIFINNDNAAFFKVMQIASKEFGAQSIYTMLTNLINCAGSNPKKLRDSMSILRQGLPGSRSDILACAIIIQETYLAVSNSKTQVVNMYPSDNTFPLPTLSGIVSQSNYFDTSPLSNNSSGTIEVHHEINISQLFLDLTDELKQSSDGFSFRRNHPNQLISHIISEQSSKLIIENKLHSLIKR